jgi:hypothetical protein
MDRATIEDQLRATDAHIAIGRQDIAQQRETIGELRRAGHDTSIAYRLLLIYEEAQTMHIDNRDRLVRQLTAPMFTGRRLHARRDRALAA